MFIGEHDPIFILEILFRVGVLYVFAILLINFLGKRGSRQMTPLEFVVIIALGSAIGDPMFYADVPLTYGMVVIAGIVFMDEILSIAKQKFSWVRRITTSRPRVVIRDGELLKKEIEKERISLAEIKAMLRIDGIKSTKNVKLGILEVNGQLSIYSKDEMVEHDKAEKEEYDLLDFD